ncbi:Alcohol dehydrogenase-like 3 [Glycine soja]|uniref:Alcohol dehydrogenase-like 3 n=1 Tax=Glycine soja TaxID=3848 RepID=A0A445L7S3_GLYSO|nr:Alcohol dehydrogenase-like 3 [Glycine soja]
MAGPEVAIRSLNSNDTRGKTITCKATVAYGPRGPFVVERVLVHPPQKMEFPSFMGILKNEAQRAYPRIFGREASGIVESVREGANDMKEGNLVVPIFNGECGDCKYCKCEKTNMCERFGVDPMRKVMVPQGFLQLMENQSCIS